MAKKVWQWLGVWLLGWGLVGCQMMAAANASPTNGQNGSHGRILVWHDWSVEDALILHEIVDRFRGLNPETVIIVENQPPSRNSQDLLWRYKNAAQIGLGPDILIGRSEWLTELQDLNLISPIPMEPVFDDRFTSATLQLVGKQEEDILYALPLALRPPALYYNRHLTNEIPKTFAELRQLAQAGATVGLSIRAETAYLGIGAFGPPLLAGDSREGLMEWLVWLREAQNVPSMVISADEDSLLQLMQEGRLAYYLGSYDELARLEAATAVPEQEGFILGVAELPQGPAGATRPLLKGELLYFNSASSENQRALAHQFATFITNQEQSTALMRHTQRVPANRLVRINAQVYPVVAAFAAQGRTALALPRIVQGVVLGSAANNMYTAVLSGVTTPAQAACELQAQLIAALNHTAADLTHCPVTANRPVR